MASRHLQWASSLCQIGYDPGIRFIRSHSRDRLVLASSSDKPRVLRTYFNQDSLSMINLRNHRSTTISMGTQNYVLKQTWEEVTMFHSV